MMKRTLIVILMMIGHIVHSSWITRVHAIVMMMVIRTGRVWMRMMR